MLSQIKKIFLSETLFTSTAITDIVNASKVKFYIKED